MPRNRRFRGWQPRHRKTAHQNPTVYHLDSFSLEDIRQWKDGQEQFIRVHWEWYSELAHQRSLILPELKSALSEAAIGPWPFSEFQRAVKLKWANDPLSVRGSVSHIGGRFNIGDIDRTKFSSFPALYLGKDKAVALQEMFQVDPAGRGELTSEELALSEPGSVSLISCFGSLESVIDLSQPDRLKKFTNLIKDFKISDQLVNEGKKLGIIVNNVFDVSTLLAAILHPNWRDFPMHVDAPASSQIFGQLVAETGIEGIKYPSKYPGKDCLVIFPQNFNGDDSFIQIMDETQPGLDRKRLDAKSVGKLMDILKDYK
jgi:hypothetical protein